MPTLLALARIDTMNGSHERCLQPNGGHAMDVMATHTGVFASEGTRVEPCEQLATSDIQTISRA